MRSELDVLVPMRDGVRLATNVHLPDAGEPVPVLLMRTAYGKDTALGISPERIAGWTRRGYALVVQDSRGRFRSEGTWVPFFCEIDDGYDAVEWCAAQPWSSGKVGMIGRSYFGYSQLAAAIAHPPSLVTIVPESTASDLHADWVYHVGGALDLSFAVGWPIISTAGDTARRLGVESPELEPVWAAFARFAAARTVDAVATAEALAEAGRLTRAFFERRPLTALDELRELCPWLFEWLEHPSYDAYWAQVSPAAHYRTIDVPALHKTGWYDVFARGSIANFAGLRAETSRPQRLVVDASIHGGGDPELPTRVGEVDFGPDALYDFERLEERWLDHWLKGEENGVLDEPPVQLFVMGADAWRDEWDWPPARATPTRRYLRADGLLSPDAPGAEEPDAFVFDPRDPVPTRGGAVLPAGLAAGPFDQRDVELRPDVLVYTTAPLAANLEVTGPVVVDLWAATTGCDTDFTAKLVAVRADGRCLNVCDGIVRARYRASRREPSPLVPGAVYAYRIELGPTSILFRQGERLRLEVSSSSYPHHQPNGNTGVRPELEGPDDLLVVTQTIHHDAAHPSSVLLPVIPR